jgi:Thymidylate synthase
MIVFDREPFKVIYEGLRYLLLEEAARVDVGEWQSLDISDKPLMVTRELMDVSLVIPVGIDQLPLQFEIQPNLPWAEDHFQERVSGYPMNPGEEYKNWPWYRGNVPQHQVIGEKFSHTYMERIWPKYAGMEGVGEYGLAPWMGIRYPYGDLDDLVQMLIHHPQTRQGYLPIWFPEDTGAVHGERVPCSLGYHFVRRNEKLHCTYYIRSCDFVRHFRDDVYLAARLLQWVSHRVKVHPGRLTMHMVSLHIFEGDRAKLERERLE